jgi:hypothetical protein
MPPTSREVEISEGTAGDRTDIHPAEKGRVKTARLFFPLCTRIFDLRRRTRTKLPDFWQKSIAAAESEMQ